jgi:Tfp pilus assembly protein PilO
MTPALRRLIGVAISLALFIGSAVIFFSLILPVSGEIQDLRGEQEALKSAFQEESATLETVKRLFEQYGGVANLQDTLSLALPTEKDVPSIINQLQGIAKTRGVIMDSLDLQLLPIRAVSEESAIRPVGVIRIEVNVQGSYEAIKDYIDAIETNVRVMDVQTVLVEGGTEGEVLSYNLIIYSYYQN